MEIRVTGRVQGVNFRSSARDEAKRLGIIGTVQNADDGSVLIYARGEEQKMAAFLEWCKKGPAFAMVTGLELAEIADKGWKDFQIVRSS